MSEKQGWGNICERVDTCALTGAGAFFAAIDKSEVLINGPLWCYFYALRHLEKARPDMYTRFYGSQPDNNAVIYGSEEYVTQELRRMLEDGHKPSVLLLESSCSLSLIGDDLAGMARKLELPFPVVTLDSGGMVGGFAAGCQEAVCAAVAADCDSKALGSKCFRTIGILSAGCCRYTGIKKVTAAGRL